MTNKTLVLLATLGAPAVSLADEARMAPGLWDITLEMDMPGMPFKLPPQKAQHCYTKDEVSKADATVPKQDKDCTVDEVKSTATKVTWKVTCNAKREGSRGEGEITFTSRTSYEGWMKLQTQGTVMTTRYKATRTGDCK